VRGLAKTLPWRDEKRNSFASSNGQADVRRVSEIKQAGTWDALAAIDRVVLAGRVRSCSAICAKAKASTRSPVSSNRKAG
jgi:hypothetical protein